MSVPHDLFALWKTIDREVSGNRRIPMEDMCQLSERLTEDKYRGSYEQVAKTVARHSSRPGIDNTELFMTLLFCFITGNADMHLKNFSLFYPEGEWVLAPAYDLVATAVVLPEDDEETALMLNGKKRKLRRSDFLTFGKTAGVHEKAVVRLLETVLRQSKSMPTLIEQSPLSPSARERFTDIVRGRAEQLRR